MRILEFAGDEFITQAHIDALEKGLDRVYAANKIDFNFTRHFVDRVNDPRNKKQITIQELVHIFVEVQKKYGKKLENTEELQAVMKDLSTDVNVPFVIEYNPRTKMLDLYAKSVMRKHNFKTSNPELTVEDWTMDSDYKRQRIDNYDTWLKAVKSFEMRNRVKLQLDDKRTRFDKSESVVYTGQYGVTVASWSDDSGYIMNDSAYNKEKEKARKEYGRRKIDDIRRLLDKPPVQIGKHSSDKDTKFDPKELDLGIKVELEHTNDRQTAENIAKDHLNEIPDYYSRLIKMEKDK